MNMDLNQVDIYFLLLSNDGDFAVLPKFLGILYIGYKFRPYIQIWSKELNNRHMFSISYKKLKSEERIKIYLHLCQETVLATATSTTAPTKLTAL